MNTLIAAALAPAGFMASLMRPLLSIVAFGFALGGGWAYLHPGWIDPALAEKFLWTAGSLYAMRYVGDLIQAAITNRI